MSKESKNKLKPNGATPYRKRFMENSDESAAFSKWVRDWKSENYLLNLIFGPKHERFKVGRTLFCIAFSFVFAVLVTFEVNLSPAVKLGEVASQTVRAPFDFQVTDHEATMRRQEEEVKQVPLVLDYYPDTFDDKLEKIRESFSDFRVIARKSDLGESSFTKKHKEDFDKSLGINIPPSLFKWLYRKDFSKKVEEALAGTVETWVTSYMLDESELRDGLNKGYALVRVINKEGQVSGEEQKLEISRIQPIVSYDSLKNDLNLKTAFSKYDRLQISNILKTIKRPNLSLNRNAFSQRKSEARKRAIPVVIPVKKNQVIIKQGSLVQAQDVLLISEIAKLKKSFKKKLKALIITVLLSIMLLSGLSLLKRKFKFSIAAAKQDFLVLFSISFFGLVVSKLFIFLFEGSLYQKFGTQLPADVVVLMSPFAMLFMLSALLVKSRPLVWLFITYYAVGLSFLGADKFSFLLVALAGGMASVRAFSVCRSRKDFYFAGLISGLVIGLSAVFVYTLQVESFTEMSFFSVVFLFGASLVGGLLSAVFTVSFVPLFESIFDVMTDLKLLELSSLSHPLLKELMVRAPGTYHHCMVVGSMVEAACNEVGVNGLLGKVMAYFHDVGKMEHADYFIENQRKNYNPHDNISPNLSKTIIIAHVKDGVELVSKHKLGRDIIAGVKEHHGTTLIKYFFNRAKERAPEGESVKEEEFRYPGPKPQFKESAILMLADSIEAAARTIDEPSPLKIQNLIDNMVDSKFSDGQLDECSITFSELTSIKAVFYRILVGVYHHRVEYPKETSSEKSKKNKDKVSAETRTLSLHQASKTKND